MHKFFSFGILFLVFFNLTQAQIRLNGQLDSFEEFSELRTDSVVMPDGIKLKTDIYIPVMQDCLMVSFNLRDLGLPFSQDVSIEVIPKGLQLFIYDSLNGQPNPNPYQIPMVFTRTPYGKDGDVVGRIISILGYAYALQDMRGRYNSEGVYMPMYSDSWNKNAYHPETKHVLDITPLTDPRNGNRHEDGYNSVQYILQNARRIYDINRDGIPDTFLICNGSLGMFGASALGNTQYQAAAAHRINPNSPGLKALLPIVATNEHYRYTGYQNGVFRERIVTGWIRGQIFSGTQDELLDIDNDINNNIHTSFDYGLTNKFDAANQAIDHFVTVQYNGPAGYYPNSKGRADMDASVAKVNAAGESVDPLTQQPLPNLTFSRYTNMEVPQYHLTGWWDIFTDGQIETYNQLMKHLSDAYGNKRLQKLVIGPWAHQTIGSTRTGDMVYKDNVADLIGVDIGNLDIDSIDISKVITSEVISWFRYNLNYNGFANIGLPKVLLPASAKWQNLPLSIKARVPSRDYKISFEQLINFITGTQGLNGIFIEIDAPLLGLQEISIDIPATGNSLIPELNGAEITTAIDSIDFTKIPNVRFYVVGPINDGIPENENLGNYWKGTEEFPLTQGIQSENLYFHQNGQLNGNPPAQDEGYRIYVHDPNDPIKTIGGANMIVRTPQGDRDSQGQFNLKDPRYAPFTMDRTGVISYETNVIEDSLCIIGFPKMTLYAKSNPGGVTSGETDTDFFIRLLDVYPDGREFFVVEGCVNARAREYARHLADLPPAADEDVNIPFSNIQIGQIYEYYFSLMPIAYTWGKGHKLKILISSSNHNRYQVNPNLPIEENAFFRRQPSDGKNYVFQGLEMEPRTAVQRIAHSPLYATRIELPVFKQEYVSTPENSQPISVALDAWIYPNPTASDVEVFMNLKGSFHYQIMDFAGKVLQKGSFDESTRLSLDNLPKGMYLLEVISVTHREKVVKKLTRM